MAKLDQLLPPNDRRLSVCPSIVVVVAPSSSLVHRRFRRRCLISSGAAKYAATARSP